ncbi:MAG: MFS transporter [Actinomycetota bacterium]|nr:MFS transporter [Actinomycetota bacterium]
MSNPTPSRSDVKPGALIGSAWSLFAALGLLLLGNGLLGSVLGIRAQIEGFGTVVTGFVMAFYYVGFLIGAQITPIAVTRVGHVRVFAGLASLASATALLHVVWVNPITWGFARTVTGACLAGLYVVAESWLNTTATNESRGRLLSIYMLVVMGGIGAGQLLLGVADPAGFGLFILGSVLVSLAVLPIALSKSPSPDFDVPPRMRLTELWRKSPIGITGGLGTGVANGALFAMGPVYGIAVGMSVSRISLFMGVMILGAVALQWPIGSWSDRVPRRRSIVAINLMAAGAALAVTQLDPNGPWLFVAVFLLGGSTFPLYSLSLSHVNDVLESRQMIAASSVFVLVTGIGSVAGPVAASLLMSATDADGLFWAVGGVHLAVGLYAIYRIVAHEGPTVSQQRSYVPIPARASGLIGVLTRNLRTRTGNGRDKS